MSNNLLIMLRINKMQACKAVAIVWLISLSVHTSAQGLMDWLTDPTGTATKIVVDEVSKQANNAWEGILNDKIQESLSKDAQKLADFRIDTTALDSIDKFYDMYTLGDGQYAEMSKRQKQLIASYFWCSSLKPIGLMANGAVREKIIRKIDDFQYPSHQISSIELLSHNHPSILELHKLWENNFLANNMTMLYYWAVLANRLDSLYPKKISFIKPHQLQLSNKEGDDKWVVLSTEGQKVLGEISKDQGVVVLDEMLLNMAAMPNATYYINDAKYKTDYLGRVISISFEMTSNSKKKSSIKGKVKPPQIMATYNAGKWYKPMELVPSKYNGVVGRMNIVPIAQIPDNKNAMKDLSKQFDATYKRCKKEFLRFPVEYQLSYSGRYECPYEITIWCAGARFVLYNGTDSQLSQVKISSSENKQPLEYGSLVKLQNEKAIAPTQSQLMAVNKDYIAENNFIANFQKPVRHLSNKTNAQSTSNNNDEMDDEDVVFVIVEKMPEFPGGQQALWNFLANNVKYPVIAQESGIQGRAVCQFIVNRDGSITDVEVVKSAGDPSLDKEAVRVMKLMPKWKPGMQNGKTVRVKYSLPVSFRLY